MDFFEIGDEMKNISVQLETIRNLSKGHSKDFRHEPYNNDFDLIRHLLHEKINGLHVQNKRKY